MTAVPQPSRERLTELFMSLAQIASPSRHERGVADVIIDTLSGLGLTVSEDLTGSAIGGDCGNLVCKVGAGPSRARIALGAHMDTVQPGVSIAPRLDEKGRFSNAGQGILGADDKAAIAVLLHATELLWANAAPAVPYELFFTVCEENGLVGAKHLNPGALDSPMAVVFDSSGAVGGIVTGAPSQKIIHARYKGVAAHAGLEPELGRSAIHAAAKAVARMRLGRLDEETTANIGTIGGGVATNIVPESCELAGECRGHDEERLADVAAEMIDALHQAAAETGVDVEVAMVDEFRAFRLPADAPVVGLATRAVTAAGLQPSLQIAGGGSDANILNGLGIPTVNLATGMMRVHSPEEYIELDDLERLCRVVLQVVAGAGEQGDGGGSRRPS